MTSPSLSWCTITATRTQRNARMTGIVIHTRVDALRQRISKTSEHGRARTSGLHGHSDRIQKEVKLENVRIL